MTKLLNLEKIVSETSRTSEASTVVFMMMHMIGVEMYLPVPMSVVDGVM